MRIDLAIACGHAIISLSDQAFNVVDDVLVFRGTLNMREIKTQLRIGSKDWGEQGTIHRGFSDLYDEIRPDLLNLMHTPCITALGGHSLGGVFAVLLADEMRREGLTVPPVFTFGAPRIGNRTFRRSINELSIFRIYNTNDPITRLPPLCCHVGERVHLSFPGNGLASHSLEKYVASLEEMELNYP